MDAPGHVLTADTQRTKSGNGSGKDFGKNIVGKGASKGPPAKPGSLTESGPVAKPALAEEYSAATAATGNNTASSAVSAAPGEENVRVGNSPATSSGEAHGKKGEISANAGKKSSMKKPSSPSRDTFVALHSEGQHKGGQPEQRDQAAGGKNAASSLNTTNTGKISKPAALPGKAFGKKSKPATPAVTLPAKMPVVADDGQRMHNASPRAVTTEGETQPLHSPEVVALSKSSKSGKEVSSKPKGNVPATPEGEMMVGLFAGVEDSPLFAKIRKSRRDRGSDGVDDEPQKKSVVAPSRGSEDALPKRDMGQAASELLQALLKGKGAGNAARATRPTVADSSAANKGDSKPSAPPIPSATGPKGSGGKPAPPAVPPVVRKSSARSKSQNFSGTPLQNNKAGRGPSGGAPSGRSSGNTSGHTSSSKSTNGSDLSDAMANSPLFLKMQRRTQQLEEALSGDSSPPAELENVVADSRQPRFSPGRRDTDSRSRMPDSLVSPGSSAGSSKLVLDSSPSVQRDRRVLTTSPNADRDGAGGFPKNLKQTSNYVPSSAQRADVKKDTGPPEKRKTALDQSPLYQKMLDRRRERGSDDVPRSSAATSMSVGRLSNARASREFHRCSLGGPEQDAQSFSVKSSRASADRKTTRDSRTTAEFAGGESPSSRFSGRASLVEKLKGKINRGSKDRGCRDRGSNDHGSTDRPASSAISRMRDSRRTDEPFIAPGDDRVEEAEANTSCCARARSFFFFQEDSDLDEDLQSSRQSQSRRPVSDDDEDLDASDFRRSEAWMSTPRVALEMPRRVEDGDKVQLERVTDIPSKYLAPLVLPGLAIDACVAVRVDLVFGDTVSTMLRDLVIACSTRDVYGASRVLQVLDDKMEDWELQQHQDDSEQELCMAGANFLSSRRLADVILVGVFNTQSGTREHVLRIPTMYLAPIFFQQVVLLKRRLKSLRDPFSRHKKTSAKNSLPDTVTLSTNKVSLNEAPASSPSMTLQVQPQEYEEELEQISCVSGAGVGSHVALRFRAGERVLLHPGALRDRVLHPLTLRFRRQLSTGTTEMAGWLDPVTRSYIVVRVESEEEDEHEGEEEDKDRSTSLTATDEVNKDTTVPTKTAVEDPKNTKTFSSDAIADGSGASIKTSGVSNSVQMEPILMPLPVALLRPALALSNGLHGPRYGDEDGQVRIPLPIGSLVCLREVVLPPRLEVLVKCVRRGGTLAIVDWPPPEAHAERMSDMSIKIQKTMSFRPGRRMVRLRLSGYGAVGQVKKRITFGGVLPATLDPIRSAEPSPLSPLNKWALRDPDSNSVSPVSPGASPKQSTIVSKQADPFHQGEEPRRELRREEIDVEEYFLSPYHLPAGITENEEHVAAPVFGDFVRVREIHTDARFEEDLRILRRAAARGALLQMLNPLAKRDLILLAGERDLLKREMKTEKDLLKRKKMKERSGASSASRGAGGKRSGEEIVSRRRSKTAGNMDDAAPERTRGEEKNGESPQAKRSVGGRARSSDSSRVSSAGSSSASDSSSSPSTLPKLKSFSVRSTAPSRFLERRKSSQYGMTDKGAKKTQLYADFVDVAVIWCSARHDANGVSSLLDAARHPAGAASLLPGDTASSRAGVGVLQGDGQDNSGDLHAPRQGVITEAMLLESVREVYSGIPHFALEKATMVSMDSAESESFLPFGGFPARTGSKNSMSGVLEKGPRRGGVNVGVRSDRQSKRTTEAQLQDQRALVTGSKSSTRFSKRAAAGAAGTRKTGNTAFSGSRFVSGLLSDGVNNQVLGSTPERFSESDVDAVSSGMGSRDADDAVGETETHDRGESKLAVLDDGDGQYNIDDEGKIVVDLRASQAAYEMGREGSARGGSADGIRESAGRIRDSAAQIASAERTSEPEVRMSSASTVSQHPVGGHREASSIDKRDRPHDIPAATVEQPLTQPSANESSRRATRESTIKVEGAHRSSALVDETIAPSSFDNSSLLMSRSEQGRTNLSLLSNSIISKSLPDKHSAVSESQDGRAGKQSSPAQPPEKGRANLSILSSSIISVPDEHLVVSDTQDFQDDKRVSSAGKFTSCRRINQIPRIQSIVHASRRTASASARSNLHEGRAQPPSSRTSHASRGADNQVSHNSTANEELFSGKIWPLSQVHSWLSMFRTAIPREERSSVEVTNYREGWETGERTEAQASAIDSGEPPRRPISQNEPGVLVGRGDGSSKRGPSTLGLQASSIEHGICVPAPSTSSPESARGYADDQPLLGDVERRNSLRSDHKTSTRPTVRRRTNSRVTADPHVGSTTDPQRMTDPHRRTASMAHESINQSTLALWGAYLNI
ncbi:unnamed protein product [Amoebophrya sp. A25]|nr:unnamed protein product [Amoebophrya sp. A25]|eukprot:GSA25T00012248001.1